MKAALPLGLVVLALAVGCGSGSEFRDEVEELRYLRAQANTTPTQWKRMKEIEKHPAGEHLPNTTVKEAADAMETYERLMK